MSYNKQLALRYQRLCLQLCLNLTGALHPPNLKPPSFFFHSASLKSFDFQLHLFRAQVLCLRIKPPTYPVPIIIPPVSFTLLLQLHLLLHSHKALPPRELHPPEHELTEDSKEAHCFCIGGLGAHWVTTGKTVILESEWSVYRRGRVKPRFVKA